LKTRVLDSWPILEWIKEKQPATDIVENVLAAAESGTTRLLMSAINVGEVYYYVRKYHGETLAEVVACVVRNTTSDHRSTHGR